MWQGCLFVDPGATTSVPRYAPSFMPAMHLVYVFGCDNSHYMRPATPIDSISIPVVCSDFRQRLAPVVISNPKEVAGMPKGRSQRYMVTVNREMTIALEVLSAKSGLAPSTQAMVILRQGLDRTIASEAVQLRLRQEQAFRSRDAWLADQSADTFVANALSAAEGEGDDVPAR